MPNTVSQRKIFVAVFFLVIFLVASFFLFANQDQKNNYFGNEFVSSNFPEDFSTILINENSIDVEVVETVQERAKGLSGREVLPENSGMLFVFDTSSDHGIWMKDMNFPLDIIWIAKDSQNSNTGVIVDIKNNASPESFPEVFKSREISDFVLEVNAGFSEMNDIKIGDKVEFDV